LKTKTYEKGAEKSSFVVLTNRILPDLFIIY